MRGDTHSFFLLLRFVFHFFLFCSFTAFVGGLARAQNLPRRLHGGGGNEAASAVLGQILGCVCVYWRVKQYLRRQRAALKATTPEKRLSATSKAEIHGKNASPKATSGIPSQ